MNIIPMCFSFEVSVITFIISWGISLYLLRKKLTTQQKYSIISLMIFSSMQIADAILWYIGMKKNNINYIVTSVLIPTILSLQILYNVFIVNNNGNPFITLLTVCSCIYLFIRFNGYSKSLCDNKLSSPIWGSNELKLWEICLFAAFIFWPNISKFVAVMFIIIPLIHIFVGGSYGSLWCAISTGLAFKYLYEY